MLAAPTLSSWMAISADLSNFYCSGGMLLLIPEPYVRDGLSLLEEFSREHHGIATCQTSLHGCPVGDLYQTKPSN